MPAQASLQRAWYRARLAIKDHLKGTDDHIDRIIRGVRMNDGVSNKLRKESPDLEGKVLADRMESAIAKSFEDIERAPRQSDRRRFAIASPSPGGGGSLSGSMTNGMRIRGRGKPTSMRFQYRRVVRDRLEHLQGESRRVFGGSNS